MTLSDSGAYEVPRRAREGRGIPEFDPVTCAHSWAMIGTWSIDPLKVMGLGGQGILDQENLLALVGPGCLHCDSEFTPLIASRRCMGPSL